MSTIPMPGLSYAMRQAQLNTRVDHTNSIINHKPSVNCDRYCP